MKAAVLNAPTGEFDIEEIGIDTPRGHEVLVMVKASGLCHSDLHVAHGHFPIPLPAVLGHELAGIVTAVGPEVAEFGIGDHVVGSLIQFCGHCGACRAGRSYQCEHPEENLRDTGEPPRLTHRGAPITQMFGLSAFAEFALVHEQQLARIPKEMPFPQAAILGCGTLTGAGAAINTAGVKAGETVAVIGVGGVGLNVILGARLCGARLIIAVDLIAGREVAARTCGATDFLISSKSDIVSAVRSLSGSGVDHVFDVVGSVQTSTEAVGMARTGGGVYVIGAHGNGADISVNIQNDLIFRQITVRGVYMGSSNIKHDIPMYADLYLRGLLDLDTLISSEICLSKINEAYQQLQEGRTLRSVITSFQ